MRTNTALIEAELYIKWDNSAFIDYCHYHYDGKQVRTAFLYRSTFPSRHKYWWALQSLLLHMQEHNCKSFPVVMDYRELLVGRLEEYI